MLLLFYNNSFVYYVKIFFLNYFAQKLFSVLIDLIFGLVWLRFASFSLFILFFFVNFFKEFHLFFFCVNYTYIIYRRLFRCILKTIFKNDIDFFQNFFRLDFLFFVLIFFDHNFHNVYLFI